MADVGLVQPLLRDEQFFDPVTGRGTTRFLQYLEELRGNINNVTQVITQEITQVTIAAQQVQTFTAALQSDIEENRASSSVANALRSQVSELVKRVEEVQQASLMLNNFNANNAEMIKMIDESYQLSVQKLQNSQLSELSKKVDDLEQLINGH